MYIYIYLYAVELKTGPMFVKTGPTFCFCLTFHPPCRKKRIFKKKQKTTPKTQFYKLKMVQLCCATYLDQRFNLYLDQFLTFKLCIFLMFSFLGLKPLIIVPSAKNAKLKETQKRKKTLFVNTPVLTVLVKMSVFCIFHFCCFFVISIFQRCF